jgi:hypothetical protein
MPTAKSRWQAGQLGRSGRALLSRGQIRISRLASCPIGSCSRTISAEHVQPQIIIGQRFAARTAWRALRSVSKFIGSRLGPRVLLCRSMQSRILPKTAIPPNMGAAHAVSRRRLDRSGQSGRLIKTIGYCCPINWHRHCCSLEFSRQAANSLWGAKGPVTLALFLADLAMANLTVTRQG